MAVKVEGGSHAETTTAASPRLTTHKAYSIQFFVCFSFSKTEWYHFRYTNITGSSKTYTYTLLSAVVIMT